MKTFCKLCESYLFSSKSCKLNDCVYDLKLGSRFKKRESDISDQLVQLRATISSMKGVTSNLRVKNKQLKKTIEEYKKENKGLIKEMRSKG